MFRSAKDYGNGFYNVEGENRIWPLGGGQTGFKILTEAIAASALHNSEERFPPLKRVQDTRQAILNYIMTWITNDTPLSIKDIPQPILWIHGPGGAGRSAIAQTIADKCGEKGVARLASSFFFSRRTSDRNSGKHLVATISYQLALNIPKTKPIIENIVESDPSIFSRAVDVQFAKLVIGPLLEVSKEFDPRKVIIIDGLDECEGDSNQGGIIRAVCDAVVLHGLPFCFLITTRPDPFLQDLLDGDLRSVSQHILVVEDDNPQNNMATFLWTEFARIDQERRPMALNWPPSEKDIETLVERASGHFIYPSTVIKFVGARRGFPPGRLKIILGIDTPFNQTSLDALYQEVLKSTCDIKGTLRIIGLLVFVADKKSTSLPLIRHLLNVSPGKLDLLLDDIHSIIDVPEDMTNAKNPIQLTQASFVDFIVDHSRSGDYYLDPKLVHADITQMCFQVLSPHNLIDGPGQSRAMQYGLNSWFYHLQGAAPTKKLLDFFAELVTNKMVLRRMDEWKDNMEDRLGRAEFLALMLLWLEDHNIQNTQPALYLSYHSLFDCEITRESLDQFEDDLVPERLWIHDNQLHLDMNAYQSTEEAFLENSCNLLDRIIKDKSRYQSLLCVAEEVAQKVLDFIQMGSIIYYYDADHLLDYPALDTSLKGGFLTALFRVSARYKLYPQCFTLKDVKCEDLAVGNYGSFGEIWKGKFRGQAVCLKVVKINQQTQIEKLVKAFSKEALLWGHVEHSNLLPFYGIYHLNDDYGRICLVSPWMENGNIRDYLRPSPKVNRLLLISDTIRGMFYLHDKNVVHGDLKGVNILVTSSGRACLADFGLSNIIDDMDVIKWTSLETTTQGKGTARFQSPELLDPTSDNPKATMASDIYAFACVCYEIFTGNVPFHKERYDHRVASKVVAGLRPNRPNLEGPPYCERGLTEKIWAIIQVCWGQDPSTRPSAQAVINLLPMENVIDDRPGGDGVDKDIMLPSHFRAACRGPLIVDADIEEILSSI